MVNTFDNNMHLITLIRFYLSLFAIHKSFNNTFLVPSILSLQNTKNEKEVLLSSFINFLTELFCSFSVTQCEILRYQIK